MQRGFVIIVNALVWGIVLIACSIALNDPGTFQDVQFILVGGATVSLLVVVTTGMLKKPQGC
jgi:hypothetical protein